MDNYFKIFDELGENLPHKYTFAGKDDEYLIYVFCTEKIDISKELDEINSLARKYSVPEFWVKRNGHKHEFIIEFKEVFVFRASVRENVKFI